MLRCLAKIRILLLLGLLLPSFMSSNAEAANDQPAYTLGSGDRVGVTVFGEDELSGEFEVDGLGTISLPLIQEVQAGGLKLRQLEQAITEKLLDGYLKDPRVSIEVLNYRPFYILGEVKQPGSYPYVSGMTFLNAVALAGGYSYRAKTQGLLLTRANESTLGDQPATEETVVLPGDILKVPERFF